MRALATWLGAAGLLWAAGFLWFVHGLPPPEDGSAAPSDAIVVLTGGSQRLESGFQLLRDGKGRVLFISGVNPQVSLADVLHISGKMPDWVLCCVVLGHQADSTLGNAIETAQWMAQRNYKSLRLVTAWYHMPRSLLEFRRAMPGIAITPHPVFPAGVAPEAWWRSHAAASLLVGEYDKYVASLFRPLATLLQPQPPAPR